MNWLAESAVAELDRQDNGPLYLGERRLLREIFSRSYLFESNEGDNPEAGDNAPPDESELNDKKEGAVVSRGSGTDEAIKALRADSENDPVLKKMAGIIVRTAIKLTSTFPLEKRDEMMPDLLSIGKMTVMRWKDEYDPSRSAKITTFLYPYVVGSMKNEMETVYSNLNHETLETDLPTNAAEEEEDIDNPTMGVDRITAGLDLAHRMDSIAASSGLETPSAGIEREDMRDAVAKLLKRALLTPMERAYIQNVTMGGMQAVDFARQAGCTKARISQVDNNAMTKIYTYLRHHPEEARNLKILYNG